VSAKTILAIILAIFTPILSIWTGILQTSCHPILWWQQGTNPACWQISMEPASSVALQVGDSYGLTAKVENYFADIPPLTWKVENKTVANLQVSQFSKEVGILTAKTPGETTLSTTFNPEQISKLDGKSDAELPHAEVAVTVTPKLEVEPKSLAMKVGDQTTLNTDFGATPLENIQKLFGKSKLRWSAENSEIATVDGNGKVTAKQVGDTTIIVELPDETYQAKQEIPVRVRNNPSQVTDIEIASQIPNNRIFPGQTFNLAANVFGEGDFDRSVTWYSSNPQVATINTQPNRVTLTASQPGETVVTAKSHQNPEQSDSQTMAVLNPREVFHINPSQLFLEPGKAKQLTVTLNGEPLDNKQVKWLSNQSREVSVQNGRVCAHKDNTQAAIAAILPDEKLENYPRLEDSIPVQTGMATQPPSIPWLRIVGAGLVAGIGTAIVTVNPIAGIAAGLGAAAIFGTTPIIDDGGDGKYYQCNSPPMEQLAEPTDNRTPER
jgi:uncharacterized protein YjdB